jgi:hypothetical protein
VSRILFRIWFGCSCWGCGCGAVSSLLPALASASLHLVPSRLISSLYLLFIPLHPALLSIQYSLLSTPSSPPLFLHPPLRGFFFFLPPHSILGYQLLTPNFSPSTFHLSPFTSFFSSSISLNLDLHGEPFSLRHPTQLEPYTTRTYVYVHVNGADGPSTLLSMERDRIR